MKTLKFFAVLPAILALAATGNVEAYHGWDGAQTPPVHHTILFDETGLDIIPTIDHSMPISTRQTCGACHNYDAITSGTHFNSSTADKSTAGRPGEPWMWVDEKTGTQIPLSYRPWPGAWKPEEVGLTPWRFTQLFARNLPGGDMADPQDPMADPEARWALSGPIEINCFACHNNSRLQDHSEWAKQVSRENFRWAATAASGLAEVGGMATRMYDSWRPEDGFYPDDDVFRVPPTARYNQNFVDGKNRVTLDLTRKMDDTRCLQCHSVTETGKAHWLTDGDVHSNAGLKCVDCHRNGENHQITRGYRAESIERKDKMLEGFSCVGCHMMNESRNENGGRLGAPKPLHKGMPVIHFEKLTCTACHSGPWLGEKPTTLRASRINTLGVQGRAQWSTELPRIAGPIFQKDDSGRLAPYRAVWPAFFAKKNGDDLVPLDPETVLEVSEGILDVQEQINKMLKPLAIALSEIAAAIDDPLHPEIITAGGDAVLLTPGKIYHPHIDGGVEVEDYAGTITVKTALWAREIAGGLVLPLIDDFDAEAEQALIASFDDTADPIDEALEAKVIETEKKIGDRKASILFCLAALVPDELAARSAALMEEKPDLKQSVLFYDGKIYKRVLEPTLKADPDVFLDSTQVAKNAMDDTEFMAAKAKDPKAWAQSVIFSEATTTTYRWDFTETLVIEDAPEAKKEMTWGYIDGASAFTPLVPEFTIRAVVETIESEETLTEEQVVKLLAALVAADGTSGTKPGDYVYISNGKLFSPGDAGTLTTSDHEKAKPYMWPLGHDVRPAGQSLGAMGCADCHANDAPFRTAVVTATGPLKTKQAATITMSELNIKEVMEPWMMYVKYAFIGLICVTMFLLIAHIIADFIRRKGAKPAAAE